MTEITGEQLFNCFFWEEFSPILEPLWKSFFGSTPPTPHNHQLQWTPTEFLDSNGLQWVYIANIQHNYIVVISPYYL